MDYQVTLPTVNAYGYYEIRLESIGGLGANLLGKILGELGANYLGLNAANFSSYGSEKRGSPVKAFVRWCAPEVELRINSPVEEPHILGLFHENMAGKLPVTAGVTEETKVVANTDRSPEDMRDRLRLHAGELFCVDAQRLAMESKSRINMVMLGAIARASGFIPLEAAVAIAEDTVGKKYPELMERNVAGIRMGYEQIESRAFSEDGKYPAQGFTEDKTRWGWRNAPLGGVNPRIGSTVSNDLSASREGYIPLFQLDKCIHCGLCDSTCPDMVFQFEPGEYKGREAMVNTGLDYRHCKGCLRCVDICPTGALVRGLEREHPEPEHWKRNKDLIAEHIDFEDVGANSWITSESFGDERRMEGGIV